MLDVLLALSFWLAALYLFRPAALRRSGWKDLDNWLPRWFVLSGALSLSFQVDVGPLGGPPIANQQSHLALELHPHSDCRLLRLDRLGACAAIPFDAADRAHVRRDHSPVCVALSSPGPGG